MHCKLVVLIFLSCALTYAASCKARPKKVNNEWWKHAIFYQIYPRSFKDNNNDGIGDLQGIISAMDHVKNLGVTGLWLSPIYNSPQVDQGYDISNFKNISEEYGTFDDFTQLVAKAHALGLKVILDFVPNHSSNEHEWFIKSENREPGYEDYYIWANSSADGGPPNNWLSNFKYSAWEYSEKRKQYYLHQFSIQQPDLNYRNPKVVQEMKDTITFWLNQGVDGFRVDAVPFLFEDTRLLDEPRSLIAGVEEYEEAYLSHIYTQNLNETYDMIYQWREHIDAYSSTYGGDARIFMTEAYANITNTMLYYGSGDRLGAHFTFNFNFITDLNINSTAVDVVTAVRKWIAHMPVEYIPNWVLGNHDNHRVATRLGPENVDGYNMLVALLPGVAIAYNGEEIGMEDGEVDWLDGQDPSACNGEEDNFNKISRDFERTPFHWDATVNAGFNTGATPWLPVSSKYLTNNLALQSPSNISSHYHIYQTLASLRNELKSLKNGSLEIDPHSDTVLTLQRKHVNETVILAFNIGGEIETIDLTRFLGALGTSELKVLVPSVSSSRSVGSVLNATNVVLQPHESIVAVQSQ